MAELTNKQRAFVSAYLGEHLFNATRSAEAAGYAGNNGTLAVVGFDNLRKPNIRAEIEAHMADLAMSADEVLARIAAHAKDNDKQTSLRALEMLARAGGLFRDRVELTWQHELNELGLPASEVFEELVSEIVGRMEVESER